MRPIKLEFRGLRSYREATQIDFSDLDLFAIIGDTGAGKSTVIEALSLALYGRKTWSGGSNLEELIADGENTMAIELTFLAEGNEWTVTRSRHRNSSAPINKLECRATGEKVDGNRLVNERVEELLGLDHSQFVRAVVLPQGRFDELLQSTRTERNKILRSIFGLDDLRRVRDDATRRRDSWRPAILEAAARRDALPPDPAEALRIATAGAEKAQQRHASLSSAIGELDTHATAAAGLAEQLDQLERAGVGFDPDAALVEPLRGLAERAAVLNDERADLVVRQTEAEARRDRAIAEQAELLRGFDNAQRARTAAGLLRSVASNLGDLDTDATAASKQLETLGSQAPTPTEPPSITEAVEHTAAERAARQTDADNALAALGRATAAWESLTATTQAVADHRATVDAAQESADAARTEAAVAGAAVATAEAAIDQAKQAHDTVMRANAAAVAAHGLAEGEPCPVCARELPQGFTPPVATDLDAAAGDVEAAEHRLVAARRAATTAETTASLRTESLSSARAALDAVLITVGEARAAVVANGLDPDAADQPTALSEHERAATTAKVALDAALEAAAAAEQARTTNAAERAAAAAAHERELAGVRQRLHQVQERIAAQYAQLGALPAAWQVGDAPRPMALEAAADRIDTMLETLEALVASARECDDQIATARQRFSELRADAVENVNSPANEIVRLLNDQITIASGIVPLLADSAEAADTPVLPAAIEAPVLLDHLPTLVARASGVIESLEPMNDRLQTRRGELQTLLHEADQRLVTMLEAAGVADLGSLHAQVGAAEAEAKRAVADIGVLEKQASAAAALDAMLDIGRPYLANLELLIQSLRDQHFVDHLVSAREVELLGEATRRLKAISNGRYGFVPDFGVVRIASGEIRSPDTLSGGERFQAALALALALVEIASRGAGKLDAVFVDEGFGSLDGAALDVALDTLGSVAGGGKLVALISHLHPVAEYVDTVFNVTKDDLFGSTITKLDAEDREALLDDNTRSGLTH